MWSWRGRAMRLTGQASGQGLSGVKGAPRGQQGFLSNDLGLPASAGGPLKEA